MMIDHPKVSVVIPLYNAEKYISNTIQSVLDQTYDNFELIILDDQSTDKSLTIARSFDDPRVIVKSHPNRIGFFRNWNASLDEIKGKYGKLLPHDDLLHSTCLEKQVSILEDFPSASFVHCGRNIIDTSGNMLIKRLPKAKEGLTNIHECLREIVRSGTNPIGEPAAVLFRSVVKNQIGYFSEKDMYTIDIDYWSRLLEFGARYTQKEILCSFRVWPGSTSIKLYKSQTRSMQIFYQKIKQKYPKYICATDFVIGLMRSYINKFLRGIFYYWVKRKSI